MCQSAARPFGERLLLLAEMRFPHLVKDGARLDHSVKPQEASERLRELVQCGAQLLQVWPLSEAPGDGGAGGSGQGHVLINTGLDSEVLSAYENL